MLGLVVFGVLFLALFVVVGVAVGIGNPAVPSGSIAVVEDAPNGTITKAEFDRALVQAAARQGLKEVPATDDPQYQLLALLCGYGFAWVGHFVFEKNRPATFKRPLYSLMGDWVMYKDIWTGKIPF